MPIEIKELVIRASIEDRPVGGAPEVDIESIKQDLMSQCAEMIEAALEEQIRR
ncbi:MAG: DUF5908 family protein [Bacteroidota bacterium]